MPNTEASRGSDPSNDNEKVTASGEELAKRDDVVIEDAGEEVTFHPSLKKVYGGNEDGKLDIASPLWEADELHPDYEKVLKAAENIVQENDAQTLVYLLGDKTIDPSVLKSLLLKYVNELLYPNDNFIKLADALTEWDKIHGMQNYDLSEELTDKDWIRYYSVLKTAEMVLKEKKPTYKEGTPAYIVETVRHSKLSKEALDHLIKEYAVVFKDKTAVDIVVMVRKGQLHKSVLNSLAKEYISGRAVPGDMNEKIKEALNELEK